MTTSSPYEILGLEKNATTKDIKIRYKDLVREFSPEHHPEKFMEIRAAYDSLLSTEMDAQEIFPIYKKPLEFLNTSSETPKENRLDKTVLGFLFETPFHTETALKSLFEQK